MVAHFTKNPLTLEYSEELQATNEELETLNEEQEATLEELPMTNHDLEERSDEVLHLSTLGAKQQ